MSFDHGSSWFSSEELATRPPAGEGELTGEAASKIGSKGGGGVASNERGSRRECGGSGVQTGWKGEREDSESGEWRGGRRKEQGRGRR